MYFTTSQFDLDDTFPAIFASAPYVDDDGDLMEAGISIHPFGKRRLNHTYLRMSVDEADRLARQLWQVVSDARNGKYHD